MASSKHYRGVKQVSNIALNLLDPTRELGYARQEFDACLSGPFANDPEIFFGAAKAKFQNKQPHLTIELLLKIRNKHAQFRPKELSLLLAQSYIASQDNANAHTEFIHAS